MSSVIRIKLKGGHEDLYGVLLAEQDGWMLLLHNPVEFRLDGYIWVNTRFIRKVDPVGNALLISILEGKADSIVCPYKSSSLSEVWQQARQSQAVVEVVTSKTPTNRLGLIEQFTHTGVRLRLISIWGTYLGYKQLPFNQICYFKLAGDYQSSFRFFLNQDERLLELRPNQGLGFLNLGAAHKDIQALEPDPISDGIYALPGWNLTLYLDEKRRLECISCEGHISWQGVRLIGLDLKAFTVLAGLWDEKDSLIIPTHHGDQRQTCYTYDKLGLMVWAYKGRIVSVQIVRFSTG